MRKLSKFLFFHLLIFGIGYNSALATHIVGGELNYKYLGANLYQITLTIYRDTKCVSDPYDSTQVVQFDRVARIGIFDINNVLIDSVFLDRPPENVITPTTGDPCLSLPTDGICYQAAVYQGVKYLDLNQYPDGFQLAYQRCCRNYSIENLENISPTPPPYVGATFYAQIPPKNVVSVNSNPVFKNWAPTFICAGYPWIFDHSATDLDGDSLVYELCDPFDGADEYNPMPWPTNPPPYINVIWKFPYSLSNIFGGIPLTIDSKTGIMTATPDMQGQFVAGVRVKEYRNGLYIGETRRDFQVNIRACQPTVVAALSTSSVVCRDKIATFTNQSSGAGRYHWDFGVPTLTNDTSNIENPSYTYPDTGSYKVKLIAYGANLTTCTDTLVTNIYIASRLLADFTFSGIPCTPTVNFTDASNKLKNTNNNFEWDFGDFSSTNTLPNPSHTYPSPSTYNVTLIVTSPFLGCKDTIIKPVTIQLKPQIDAGPDTTVCPNDSILIGTNSQAGFSYNWLPTSGLNNSTVSQPKASPTITTTYIVTMSNADNSCTAKDTVIITRGILPIANAGPDTTVCSLDTSFIGSNPIGFDTYSWNPSTALNNPLISNPKAFPSDTTTYTVTVRNSFGCTASDAITIATIALPVADAGPDIDVCFLSTSTQIGLAGNPFLQYIWTPASSLNNPNISNPIASPSATETYFLTVTDPATTCKNKDQMVVNVLPYPAINAGPDKDVCIGSSIVIGTINNPTYTYNWTPSSSLDYASSAMPNASPTVNTTYILTSDYTTVTCTKKDTIVVTVRDTPTAFAGLPIHICKGTPYKLTPTTSGGVKTYIWSSNNLYTDTLNSNGDSTAIVIPIHKTSIYFLKALNQFSCAAFSSIQIEKDSVLILTNNDIVCENSPAQISISNVNNNPNLIYQWIANSDILSYSVDRDTLGISVSDVDRKFYVKATDTLTNCIINDSAFVNISRIEDVQAYSDQTTIYEGESTLLKSLPADSNLYFYSWTPTERVKLPLNFESSASPLLTTTYNLVIRQKSKPYCMASDTLLINVKDVYPCGEPDLFIPNAFTPDGNGNNDILFVRGNNIKTMKFIIFNRWGEKVFESIDQKSGWDGIYKGKPADLGVYVYYIEITCIQGGSMVKKGNVTLLR